MGPWRRLSASDVEEDLREYLQHLEIELAEVRRELDSLKGPEKRAD